jgi:hypothetical protein
LGFDKLIIYFIHNIGGMGCNYIFNNYFHDLCDVWLGMGIIQCKNPTFIAITNLIGLLVEFSFCWPTKVDHST